MNKLMMLTIEMPYDKTNGYIHPTVLCDDASRVLVDCGYVGSLAKI